MVLLKHQAWSKCKKALKQLSNQNPSQIKSPISTSKLQMNPHTPLQTSRTWPLRATLSSPPLWTSPSPTCLPGPSSQPGLCPSRPVPIQLSGSLQIGTKNPSSSITTIPFLQHATINNKMLKPYPWFQTLISRTQYQDNLPTILKMQQPSPLSQTIYHRNKQYLIKIQENFSHSTCSEGPLLLQLAPGHEE